MTPETVMPYLLITFEEEMECLLFASEKTEQQGAAALTFRAKANVFQSIPKAKALLAFVEEEIASKYFSRPGWVLK